MRASNDKVNFGIYEVLMGKDCFVHRDHLLLSEYHPFYVILSEENIDESKRF
jgi:hypothetical protein